MIVKALLLKLYDAGRNFGSFLLLTGAQKVEIIAKRIIKNLMISNFT